MKDEKKVIFVQNIIISILFGGIFTLLGQYFGGGKIMWDQFLLPFAFGTVVGFIIVQLVPIAKLGVLIAIKLKAKPNSFVFGLIVSFVLCLVFVPLMTTIMSIFMITVLGKLPIAIALSAAFSLKGIPLFFIIAWPIALIISVPCEKIARGICKTPKQDYSQGQEQ